MKIGITKPRGSTAEQFLLHSQEIFEITLSEWDVLDFMEISPKKRAQIRRRLALSAHRIMLGVSSSLIFANPDVCHERISIIEEIAEEMHAEGILLRVTAGKFNTDETLQWIARSREAIWVDQGRSPVSLTTNQEVIDPLWHRPGKKHREAIFKLHGWHPSRWIRYYGNEQLLTLKKIAEKISPQAILFAHSMRNEEAIRFQELLKVSAQAPCKNSG